MLLVAVGILGIGVGLFSVGIMTGVIPIGTGPSAAAAVAYRQHVSDSLDDFNSIMESAPAPDDFTGNEMMARSLKSFAKRESQWQSENPAPAGCGPLAAAYGRLVHATEVFARYWATVYRGGRPNLVVDHGETFELQASLEYLAGGRGDGCGAG